MKLQLATSPADTFYFNFDLRNTMVKLKDENANTAILEIALFRYYIALYDGCIQWGKVDEDGYL
jgi:hypothetical protein